MTNPRPRPKPRSVDDELARKPAGSEAGTSRPGPSGTVRSGDQPAVEPVTAAQPTPRPAPDEAASAAPQQNARPRPAALSMDKDEHSPVEPDTTDRPGPSQPHENNADPEDVPQEPKKDNALLALWRRRRRGLIKLVIVAVIVAVVAVLLRFFVVAPYYIPSESMEPTLHGCTNCDNDHVLVDKVSYRFGDPSQSDIVVFDRPKGVDVSEDVLIKRVIAVPGDKISIKKGRVIIDGTALREPYLNENTSCYSSMDMGPRKVPEGHYFVMGDNRCDSTDSRIFGSIPESSIVGRAWLIVWPLKRIGTP